MPTNSWLIASIMEQKNDLNSSAHGWPLDLQVTMLNSSQERAEHSTVSLSFSNQSTVSFETEISQSVSSSFCEKRTITLGEMLGIKAATLSKRIARSITGSFRSSIYSSEMTEESTKGSRIWKFLDCKCNSDNEVVDSIVSVSQRKTYDNAAFKHDSCSYRDYVQFLMNHPMIDRDWDSGNLWEKRP